MKTEQPKMDKRSVRSRKWLLNALLELIREKPLAEVSVSEITDRADISRQTFYIHYYNKRDLFNELLEREFLQFRDALLTTTQAEYMDSTRISHHIFSIWQENMDSLSVLLTADEDNRLLKRLGQLTGEIVDNNIRQLQRARGVKADYIADFISAGSFAMLQRWINNSDEMSPTDLAEIVGGATDAIGKLAGD